MKQPLWLRIPRPILLVVFSPLLVILALTDRYGNTIEFLSMKVIDTSFEVGGGIRDIWRIFVGLVRLVGWITIVLLVVTSVATLTYIVLHESSIAVPYLDPYYPIVSKVFSNKVAWAAITVVMAAMVALSHLQNLEINQHKFNQEQQDRWKREQEEKLARDRESRVYPTVAMPNVRVDE